MSEPTRPSPRLQIVSQAFRYCDYGEGTSLTRTLRTGVTPIQFVINLACEDELKEKEAEIQIELRDEQTQEPVFETLWVTKLAHSRQESAMIFRELPPELEGLQPGVTYTYFASALVNETKDYAERATRTVTK